MRVLVTGGAGYIGSVLVPQLVKSGHQVRVVDSLYFGKNCLQSVLSKIELVKSDIRNVSPKIFENTEAVVHLAALSNDPMCNLSADLTYQINTEATMRLARLAKAKGVKRLVFASTCAVYRHTWRDKNLYKENDPVAPQEHYTRSKYLAEQAILQLATPEFAVTVLRKGTVVGYSPRQRFDLVVNTMIKNALCDGIITVFDGTQHRPVVDVKDAAMTYAKLLRTPIKLINGQVFNLGSKNYLIWKVAREVKKVVEKLSKQTVKLVHQPRVKDRSYRVSSRKLQTVLGVVPNRSVAISATSLLKLLMKNRIVNFADVNYHNVERMKQLFPRL